MTVVTTLVCYFTFAHGAADALAHPGAFPETLPVPQYDQGEILRRVGTTKAYLSFRNRHWKVPDAFRGETLAIRPRLPDGCFNICFGAREIASINLNSPETTETV